MPFSRKTWNRATSLLFILAYSLVAAFPSKLDHLGLVLAGRDSNTAVSTFNSQINQDGLVSGNVKAELFPTGGATSYGNPEDTFLDYGDGNPQAELISANPSENSRCGQDVNQVPSGKVRFKRQKPDICLPDAYQTKPGAVQQKTPVKNQIEGQEQPPNPGLNWEPFPPISKPQTGPTIDGKCPNLDYTVAVCYAPWKSSVIPQGGLLGGLMGLLDPVSFASGLGCATREEIWCCKFVLPHVNVDRLQVVPVPPPGVQAEIQANLDRWTGYTCIKPEA